MKAEKIILSFIAVLGGILVAGVAFYFYQGTKIISPSKTKTVTLATPTPTPLPSGIFLGIDIPKDETVVDTKSITFSGKTISDAVVIISTGVLDQTVKPVTTGNFSATVGLDNGVNTIKITAIAQNGEQVEATKTVTFSTESF